MTDQSFQEERTNLSIWLVAKPKDISIDELSTIKFPRKPKSTTIIKDLHINNNNNEINKIECKFNKPSSKTFLVELKSNFQKNKMENLKPSAELRGVVWVNKHLPIDDLQFDSLQNE